MCSVRFFSFFLARVFIKVSPPLGTVAHGWSNNTHISKNIPTKQEDTRLCCSSSPDIINLFINLWILAAAVASNRWLMGFD